MTDGYAGWDGIGASIKRRQADHERRLAWLRSLKVGDEVVLRCDGADRLATVERVRVTKTDATFSGMPSRIEVEGHRRRNLLAGATPGLWERTGRDWLRLRIEPAEDA
jgi:hypothetical protein